MQKIRKIFKTVSEKTALPTNQPIITNNTDLIGPRWSRSNKKYKQCIEFINSKIYIMTKIKGQLNMYILQLCESSNNVTFKP